MKLILTFLLFIFTQTTFAKDVINIDEKIAQAQKEEKNIMFYFHIPDCPYCTRMLDENFKDEKILNLIKGNLILVDIYTAEKKDFKFKDFKGSAKEFAKHIGINAYPATLFMDKNAKVLHKAIGYRNIQEYIYEIKYITTQSNKKMDLEKFIFKMEMEDED